MSKRGGGKRFQRIVYDTRIDRFLYANDVNLDELAEALKTTRHNLLRIRRGKHKQRQDSIALLVLALRHILRRAVMASDLFYLGEERDDDTPEANEFLSGRHWL